MSDVIIWTLTIIIGTGLIACGYSIGKHDNKK